MAAEPQTTLGLSQQPKNPVKGIPLGGKSNATPFGSKTVRFVG